MTFLDAAGPNALSLVDDVLTDTVEGNTQDDGSSSGSAFYNEFLAFEVWVPDAATGGYQLALRQAFDDAGLDIDRPVTTTCGSGVTACVLALGLHLIGHDQVAVYDGSWSEWGARDDTKVES